MDIVDLLTGESPKLQNYSLTKAGEGLPIERREGFKYYHLAGHLKNKLCEPFLVHAPHEKDADKEIALSRHEGQEFNYVLKGQLKLRIENNIEVLEEGDSVIYDSGKGHGMTAFNGDCTFLAIVLKKAKGGRTDD